MMKALVIALTLSASSAAATELPRYDVDANCRAMVASSTGTQVAQNVRDRMVNFCIAGQQAAYGTIKEEWPELTEKEQTDCLHVARGTTNYRSVQYCVDSAYTKEMERKRDSVPQTFRY